MIIRKYLIIVMLSLLLAGCNNTKEEINEEAFPVRKQDIIVGLNYKISINTKKDKLIINTKLIDSINHYKDFNSINNFFIKMIIDNNSKKKYYLKKIEINNNSNCIKKYNYNILLNKKKNVLFLLDDKIINKIKKNIKNSKVTIYIEKK